MAGRLIDNFSMRRPRALFASLKSALFGLFNRLQAQKDSWSLNT